MKAAPQNHCAVIGMHRGGTSAVTSCLHELGWAVPKPADLIMANDNPHHFESRPIVNLNDELLTANRASWSHPIADGLETPTGWTVKAQRTLNGTFTASPWVLKDPRLCLTYSRWRPVLSPDLRTILVVRSPGDVVASLVRRNGISETHAYALWEHYMATAEASLQGTSTFVISFEELRAEPRRQLQALADFLSYKPDAETIDSAVNVLDSKLGRSRTSGKNGLCVRRFSHLLNHVGSHSSFATRSEPTSTWALDHLTAVADLAKVKRELVVSRRKPVKIAIAKLPIVARVHAAVGGTPAQSDVDLVAEGS